MSKILHFDKKKEVISFDLFVFLISEEVKKT